MSSTFTSTRARQPITSHRNPNWMLLFIDVDGDRSTGWEGYDFVVNRSVGNETTSLLEENSGGWTWRRKAEVRYRVRGNELAIAIPRSELGLEDRRQPLQVDFKWMDNLQRPGEVDEFTLNGDSAPNGRLNYRYQAVHVD